VKYDWEATVRRSPQADKFYWCKGCGEFNNPFRYTDLEEFKRQIKLNLCPNCVGKKEDIVQSKLPYKD
jgi:Zn finger protein HypA/HybF involved in hydrogenase expression